MYRLLTAALNQIVRLYTFCAGAHVGADARKVIILRQFVSIRAMRQLYCERDLGRPIAINTGSFHKQLPRQRNDNLHVCSDEPLI